VATSGSRVAASSRKKGPGRRPSPRGSVRSRCTTRGGRTRPGTRGPRRVRALGVLGYQVLMPGHSTTDVEQSFLRHSNIRCRCLSRVKIPRCANDIGTVGLPQRTDVLVTGLARGVRAISGCEQPQQTISYSITSSTSASNLSGRTLNLFRGFTVAGVLARAGEGLSAPVGSCNIPAVFKGERRES
jgi:hypothetical protein